MERLTDDELIMAYNKALELQLENDFLKLIKTELNKRVIDLNIDFRKKLLKPVDNTDAL